MNNNISRKDFLKNSALGLAGFSLGYANKNRSIS